MESVPEVGKRAKRASARRGGRCGGLSESKVRFPAVRAPVPRILPERTNFINGILEDGFARQDPTLLLCCEEGEEEYEKNALDNVTVITIEDEEDLKCSYLKELEKEYHPKQVLIEYNGMWQMERLYREVLPANWVLYQIMTFVYAPTFEMYA